ncbi:hypothetical protein WI888_10655, partial [Salmonella enterica subsp. enterica serovar Corvallis]
ENKGKTLNSVGFTTHLRARFLLTGLKQYGYCTYVHKGNSYEAHPVFLRILFYLPLTGRRFVM